MKRLPPPISRPIRPKTKNRPPCTSSHSEDFSSLPAAWSRELILASRSWLRRSTLAAVSFAEAKVTSVSSRLLAPSAVAPPWDSVYLVTRSAALRAFWRRGDQHDEQDQHPGRARAARRTAPRPAASRRCRGRAPGAPRLDRRERLGGDRAGGGRQRDLDGGLGLLEARGQLRGDEDLAGQHVGLGRERRLQRCRVGGDDLALARRGELLERVEVGARAGAARGRRRRRARRRPRSPWWRPRSGSRWCPRRRRAPAGCAGPRRRPRRPPGSRRRRAGSSWSASRPSSTAVAAARSSVGVRAVVDLTRRR